MGSLEEPHETGAKSRALDFANVVGTHSVIWAQNSKPKWGFWTWRSILKLPSVQLSCSRCIVYSSEPSDVPVAVEGCEVMARTKCRWVDRWDTLNNSRRQLSNHHHLFPDSPCI